MAITVQRRPVHAPVERIEVSCFWFAEDKLSFIDFQDESCVVDVSQKKRTTDARVNARIRMTKEDAKQLAEALSSWANS